MWFLHTVLNALKLFLLISFGLTFLLGLGWLVVGPLLHGGLTTRKRDTPLLQEISLALISGLIINHGIVLCLQLLKTSLILGGIVSSVGTYCFAVGIFRNRAWQITTLGSANKWLGIIFVCLLFFSPILAQPLTDWDARSIWFFHAKMIYTAGTFGQAAGWQHPSVAFSHTDYPNLVPVLAAQVTYVVGFWNEYIPKLSLVFMLVPAMILLFTFARRSFSFVVLLLLIPFSIYHTTYSLLWNGYMDGYLALYFSIAMLLLGRYVNLAQPVDLISSAGCLIILLYIKNEGTLAALIGFCLIGMFSLLKNKPYFTGNKLSDGWKYFLAGIFTLLPYVLWNLYKRNWNLSNDLDIGTIQSLSRVFGRLQGGAYKFILESWYKQIESALLLAGLLYAASVSWNKPVVRASLPAFMAAGIYSLGMLTIYLLTPYNLTWHLNTSISRTMFSVNGCIFIGCYFMLDALENQRISNSENTP